MLALTCSYVDLDDDGAATSAKDKYGTEKPSKVVVTGQGALHAGADVVAAG